MNSYNQKNRFRVRFKKDRAKFKDMEAELDEIIKTMRENGAIVSGFYIKMKAINLCKKNIQTFNLKLLMVG